MFNPQSEYEGQIQGGGIGVWFGNMIGALLAYIPWLGYYVLAHLLLRQNQECEYLADRLATEVAGTRPVKSLLTSLRRRESFYEVVKNATENKVNVFYILESKGITQPSPHELERLRRLEEKTGLSLDATHPPVQYRLNYVDSFPEQPPRVKFSNKHLASMKVELTVLRDKLSQKLTDTHLDSVS